LANSFEKINVTKTRLDLYIRRGEDQRPLLGQLKDLGKGFIRKDRRMPTKEPNSLFWPA
jgi:hypothetical protein